MGFMKILKELLKKKGFTQQALAELIEVPQSTLASWISGKGTPKHDNLVKLSQGLGVSPEELLGRERPANFDDMTGWVKLRVISKVPADVPIEAVEEYSGEIVVPPEHARPGCFALEVHGNSMVPRIMDGDVVVVTPCPDPYNGQIVVTRINSDGDVTLKKFQRDNGAILLVPENPEYQTRLLTPDSNIKILGSVIALHRRL
ncbi:MAG: SOS-response repressor and protease LexA [Candidatus Rifleibacterium amylolyticum]|nr:MAG: SOS-response repressor and protease LexA [Candidatus Rifleibacterium amylolyticum]